MTSPTVHPQQLLHYVATNRVLICTECRYAIQPSAISRHLKELHHVYRSNRQELMRYAQSLDLANPGDVILPEPDEAPIPFLPTVDGLVCGAEGCGHLCASTKRMKSHWATVHRGLVLEPHEVECSPVRLQTFFRGNQLRYFIVSKDSMSTSQPQQKLELDRDDSNHEVCIQEVPSNTDSEWSADDLDLLEQFTNSTYFDMGYNPESRRLWQAVVPLIARKHTFLKHGMLAVSALHRATQIPSQRQRYQLLAAWHQNRALPAFRSEISNPNEHNCNALLAFAQLLVVHCFASEEQDEDLLFVRGSKESGLPDWLELVRSSCSIFGSLSKIISDGPLQKLMDEMDVRSLSVTDFPSNTEYSRRLGLLLHVPSFNRLPNPKINPDTTIFPLPGALFELLRAFAKANAAQSRSMFTMWAAVYIWPAQVSYEYLDLLKDRDPVALIFLAHYCILLKPLESRWYMNGFTKRLLSRISDQLDPEWRQWIQWPLDETQIQE